MLLAILIGAAMADERGDALGIVTLFGWAALALAMIFERDELVAHKWVDRGVASVFVFFTGAAMLTDLPLVACAAIAVAVAAALWVYNARRERRRSEPV